MRSSHGYVANRLAIRPPSRVRLHLEPARHIADRHSRPADHHARAVRWVIFFGWAKPVPIDPRNSGMTDWDAADGNCRPGDERRTGLVAGLVSRAFPAAVFAPGQFTSIGSVLLSSATQPRPGVLQPDPIPPLDGSRVVQWFLPTPHATLQLHRTLRLRHLIGATWMIPGLFGAYLAVTVVPIFGLLTGAQ